MDYKDWLQFFPETVSGLPQSGKPEGMNMETGDAQWPSAHHRYEGSNSHDFNSGHGASKWVPMWI